MGDPVNVYNYQSIDAKDEIRVLRLEPGSFASPLIGTLLVRKLGDDEESPPAYNCVSYAWGPQRDFTSFACDGKSLRITCAVDEMLRHLRKSTRPHFLWIDAICINQADNQEKNHQVRSMGRTYALARKVRIWLGRATDEEIDAVYPLFSRNEAGIDSMRQVMKTIYCESFATSPALIEDFFSRAWFTRRWILQEVILASVVTVHCGHHKAPWAQFCSSAYALSWIYNKERFEYKIDRRGTMTMRTLATITTMDNHKDQTLHDIETGSSDESIAYVRILDLLQEYHTAKCMDERDRLYALYGMSPGTALLTSSPVNYNLHFSTIYTHFASAAIQAGQFHKILEHAIEFGGLDSQDRRWPSWTPSWNTTRTISPFAGIGHGLEHHLRATPFPPKVETLGDLRACADENPWSAGTPTVKHVYAFQGLHLRGCIHRIVDSASKTAASSNAISYFETILDGQCTGRNGVMARYKVAWILTLAIEFATDMFSLMPLGAQDFFTMDPFISDWAVNTCSWEAMKRMFGLDSDKYTKAHIRFDKNKVVANIKQILGKLDAFCYHVDGALTFGVAFARVEHGDFVFRSTGAVGAKVKNRGVYSPSLFGFIVRPFYGLSCTGPATYRLVGICLDFYPDRKDPEDVDVVLV